MVFTCTVESIFVPSVLLLVVPPFAFQHQATNVSPLEFTLPQLGKLNPSASNDVTPKVVCYAASVFGAKLLLTPLVLSETT